MATTTASSISISTATAKTKVTTTVTHERWDHKKEKWVNESRSTTEEIHEEPQQPLPLTRPWEQPSRGAGDIRRYDEQPYRVTWNDREPLLGPPPFDHTWRPPFFTTTSNLGPFTI